MGIRQEDFLGKQARGHLKSVWVAVEVGNLSCPGETNPQCMTVIACYEFTQPVSHVRNIFTGAR